MGLFEAKCKNRHVFLNWTHSVVGTCQLLVKINYTFILVPHFQGEVIKTRGGGQAVQFTDIETLKQELTTVPG